MKYYELICKAYIKKEIIFKHSFEIMAKYISYTMAKDEKLRAFHYDKGFKYYCFGGFLPIEKEKVYKAGNTYSFNLRSLDESFIDMLSKILRKNINNPNLQIIETYKRVQNQFFISELYSLTPVIASIENNKYWTMQSSGDILKLQKQLHDNLEKKYKNFYSNEIKAEQNFIQLLELKNHKPQNIEITKNEKQVRLFGNKFKITPNEDETSQKLAFVALGSGLGEKNSIGGGFCLGRGVRS
jgi:CRISPR-associated endoribonuclease Cas6